MNTETDGTTCLVECDADGNEHGRLLYCDRDTRYFLFEHGKSKEWAIVYAGGRCTYDGGDCSADFAPFVPLKAKVLPIKARPH